MHLIFCCIFARPYTFNVKDTFLWPKISDNDFTSNSGISMARNCYSSVTLKNFFKKRAKNCR